MTSVWYRQELRAGRRCELTRVSSLRLVFNLSRHLKIIVIKKKKKVFLFVRNLNRLAINSKGEKKLAILTRNKGGLARMPVTCPAEPRWTWQRRRKGWQGNQKRRILIIWHFFHQKRLNSPSFALSLDCPLQNAEVFVARKLDVVRPSFRWPVRS